MAVVGLDLGYHTSFVAVARQGGIETVANEYSDRNTPMVVSLTDRNRYMGASAKNQLMSNSKNTVLGWKPLLGKQFKDPIVQREKNNVFYNIVEGADGRTNIKVNYLGEPSAFTPEQITSMMLTKLKDTAGIALKTKVVDCVMAVPCYITDKGRRMMLEAAHMSGLNCLRLITDTTATALAYGIYKQDLPAPEEKPRNVVFVDLGHSDLQVCACAFNKGKLKVLATVADENLGGRDIDSVIANHFAVDFKKRYKVDAHTKPRAWLRLLQESEKIKKLMSANSTDIPMNIECFMDDKDVSGRMKREDMESLAAPLFQRLEKTLKGILDATRLKLDDIYAVEIVGGATRVPAVKDLVRKVFGKEPSTTLNADEAVARGCALQCAILSPVFRVRDFSITDCQPYPINLNWIGSIEEDGEMEVFSRYHPVPFSKMLTFYRKEPFTLEARYSSPQDIPLDTQKIGSFEVQKVTPQANGESAKIKVKVRVNIHGLFSVACANMLEKIEPGAEDTADEPMEVETGPSGEEKPKDEEKEEEQNKEEDKEKENSEVTNEGDEPKEGKVEEKSKDDKKDSAKKKSKVKTIDLPIQAYVPGFTKEQLNSMFEKENHMIAQDKMEKDRIDAKNSVEEYVYDMRDKLYGALEKFVKEKDKDVMLQLLDKTENWLYEEGEDEKKHAYVERLKELKALGDPVVNRCMEYEYRNVAFSDLGLSLQLVRKALDLYHAQDEKYIHIESAEMEKVAKCLEEKTAWFESSLNACSKMSLQDNPPITSAQIRAEKMSLDAKCSPILNKPKPKPKEEPPKEEVKDETKKPEGEMETTENAENVETKTESQDTKENGPDPDMELD